MPTYIQYATIKAAGKKLLQILVQKYCDVMDVTDPCYIEVNASFQLEKENTQKNVTAFAKVLSAFLEEDIYNYVQQ